MKYDVNDETLKVRYLNKELSPEETAWFEDLLMEDEKLFEELQMTLALIDASKHYSFVTPTEKRKQRWRDVLSSPVISFPLGVITGLAASVLLTISLLSEPELQVYSSGNVLFLETSRGVSTSKTKVTLDNNNKATMFIQTADISPTNYQLQLVESVSGNLLVSEQVSANAAGELVIVVQLSELKEQHLDLVLTNQELNKRDILKLFLVRP